jgi:hypothetical protein
MLEFILIPLQRLLVLHQQQLLAIDLMDSIIAQLSLLMVEQLQLPMLQD